LVRDYANATNLRVKLDMISDTVKIAVHDNGRGFDAEAIFNEPDEVQDPRSKALVALRERFSLVAGSMAVHSNETDGTLVRLELPT
jgi:signal transduction histidine kinase